MPISKDAIVGAVNAGKVIELKSNDDLKSFFDALDESSDQIPSNGAIIMGYASWCGHCKAMHDDYDELAAQAGKFPVAKIDADANGLNQIAGYQITGYPTVIIAKDKSGVEDMKFGSDKYKGARTADAMRQTIERVFGLKQIDDETQEIDMDAVAVAGDACETDFVDDSAFELAADEQLEL
eukprot:tig00021435_g21399.t1